METPKKPLKNTDSKNTGYNADEDIDAGAKKKFVDEDEDDFDAPLDDVDYEDYDDFDDDDY